MFLLLLGVLRLRFGLVLVALVLPQVDVLHNRPPVPLSELGVLLLQLLLLDRSLLVLFLEFLLLILFVLSFHEEGSGLGPVFEGDLYEPVDILLALLLDLAEVFHDGGASVTHVVMRGFMDLEDGLVDGF